MLKRIFWSLCYLLCCRFPGIFLSPKTKKPPPPCHHCVYYVWRLEIETYFNFGTICRFLQCSKSWGFACITLKDLSLKRYPREICGCQVCYKTAARWSKTRSMIVSDKRHSLANDLRASGVGSLPGIFTSYSEPVVVYLVRSNPLLKFLS